MADETIIDSHVHLATDVSVDGALGPYRASVGVLPPPHPHPVVETVAAQSNAVQPPWFRPPSNHFASNCLRLNSLALRSQSTTLGDQGSQVRVLSPRPPRPRRSRTRLHAFCGRLVWPRTRGVVV
jgi:hypothetical protein